MSVLNLGLTMFVAKAFYLIIFPEKDVSMVRHSKTKGFFCAPGLMTKHFEQFNKQYIKDSTFISRAAN